MYKPYRTLMAGRGPEAETTALINALQLKYTTAQMLLNGDE